eukprot:16452388-Heterocapsa_arctica.AAC.1
MPRKQCLAGCGKWGADRCECAPPVKAELPKRAEPEQKMPEKEVVLAEKPTAKRAEPEQEMPEEEVVLEEKPTDLKRTAEDTMANDVKKARTDFETMKEHYYTAKEILENNAKIQETKFNDMVKQKDSKYDQMELRWVRKLGERDGTILELRAQLLKNATDEEARRQHARARWDIKGKGKGQEQSKGKGKN